MEDIVIRNLCKSFDGKPVLCDFSAGLPAGQVTGLMAPSGAGKTTLLRILMGLERPDSGTIDGLAGLRLSAVFQEDRLCDNLDPSANIRLSNPSLGRREAEEALTAVGLAGCLQQPVRELSGGMCRRVAILRALLAEYDLLFLDEPTSGLDPLMQSRFIDLVLEEKRRGATILLSSHLFDEVERTCDRVAFIRAGRLAAVERMNDVRKGRKRVFAGTFADETTRDRYAQAHPDARKQGAASLEAAVAGNPDAFVKDLAAYDIVDLAAREQTLEELFMHLYGTTNQVEKGGSHE